MTKAEVNYKLMTQKTNTLKQQLDKIVGLMPILKEKELDPLLDQAKKISHELTAWDSKMAQRLSKAYDDVENYENGFTAHYLTVLNQVDASNRSHNKCQEPSLGLDARLCRVRRKPS